MRIYGESFLTKPRRTTTDAGKAEGSIWNWQYRSSDQTYTLSLLGIINGVLQHTGLAFTCHTSDGDAPHQILRYSLKRKWW